MHLDHSVNSSSYLFLHSQLGVSVYQYRHEKLNSEDMEVTNSRWSLKYDLVLTTKINVSSIICLPLNLNAISNLVGINRNDEMELPSRSRIKKTHLTL